MKKYITFFLVAVLLLIFVAGLPFFDSRVHIVFCDVGQGDGILIYKKDIQVVIDAGSDGKILSCLGRHAPFWDRKIEALILTNSDLDHYGGFIEIVRRYDVQMFASNLVGKNDKAFETLENEIQNHQIAVKRLDRGDTLLAGDLEFVALWPTTESLADVSGTAEGSRVLGAMTSTHANDYSLVLNFNYGDFNALLTGDIVPPATDIVAGDQARPVELLKVPHHGSRNGLTEKLLISSAPQLAVISAGLENRYGHPHKETLGMLERLGVKTLCTCWTGEIEVITDGITWTEK